MARRKITSIDLADLFPRVGRYPSKVDVGPYLIWKDFDGCIIREVKPFKELNKYDFVEGFEPALETIPYTYDPVLGILEVAADIGLWGWQRGWTVPSPRSVTPPSRSGSPPVT